MPHKRTNNKKKETQSWCTVLKDEYISTIFFLTGEKVKNTDDGKSPTSSYTGEGRPSAWTVFLLGFIIIYISGTNYL